MTTSVLARQSLAILAPSPFPSEPIKIAADSFSAWSAPGWATCLGDV